MEFREFLEADNLTEGVSDSAKTFLKKFNEQVKFLKEDIKTSDSNDNWKNRLKGLKQLIEKEI